MANTRFTGTYEFIEKDRWHGRTLPPCYDRHVLDMHLVGELEFEVGELKDKINIDLIDVFASGDYLPDLYKVTVEKFKRGGVEKLIKELIIRAIRRVKETKESKTIKQQYDELISGVSKYSIELNIKSKDLD